MICSLRGTNKHPLMTVLEFIRENTALLLKHGIQTARLDCLVLLEDALNTNRTHLLAYPEQIISDQQLVILTENLRRRVQHEPLAYIRGHTEFYSRTFAVDEHVLVPRPESEAMIDLLKQYMPAQSATIIDIGTGSGALAITAKCIFPNAPVIATDIDPACLAIAGANASKHNAAIAFFEGSLLQAVPSDVLRPRLVLLCNLPYVPNGYVINKDATYEPPKALFAGDDGLDLYRDIFHQLDAQPATGVFIITEALQQQHAALTSIAQASGFQIVASEGLAQCFARP